MAQHSAHAPARPAGQVVPLLDLDRMVLRRCVHCGLCLDFCPTYRLLGNELDSPRGRIWQVRALADGRIQPDDPHLRTHIGLCLDCRACETACPSGVQYGQIVEAARAVIPPASWRERLLRRLILGTIFPSPPLLELVGFGLRLYQKSGLQGLLRRSGLLRLLPGRLADLEAMLPPLQGGVFRRPLPPTIPAQGMRRARVALITGCVAAQFFNETNWATARVLARNGCEVVVPAAQRCCGALHLHSGEREVARALARQNIAAFEATGADYYVINAAGCGSTLKEYGHLLAHDPAWAERARAFSQRVRDVTELLAQLPLEPPRAALRCRVTYQDACHLAHGQRIREQPRQLLQAIPGLELVEMRGADECCGSAGIYNVVHYDVAVRLLEQKIAAIAATGAEIVAAANPGCLIQIAYGLRRQGLPLQVAHPVDLLDRAYAQEKASS